MVVETASARVCFLASAAGIETEACDDTCPLRAGRSCILDRLMPREDWDAAIARRWLDVRESLLRAVRTHD